MTSVYTCDMLDLTGKTFNRLTCIRSTGTNKHGLIMWECQCVCGRVKEIAGCRIVSGSTKSCGCLKQENIKARFGSNHPGWEGFEQLSGTFLKRMEVSAAQRGWEWHVTPKILWDIYVKQGCRCALSGREIRMPINVRQLRKSDHHLASLDRIDPTRGYEPDNVQWICKRLNYMKHILTEEMFMSFVKDVYEYKVLGKVPKITPKDRAVSTNHAEHGEGDVSRLTL